MAQQAMQQFPVYNIVDGDTQPSTTDTTDHVYKVLTVGGKSAPQIIEVSDQKIPEDPKSRIKTKPNKPITTPVQPPPGLQVSDPPAPPEAKVPSERKGSDPYKFHVPQNDFLLAG